MELRAVFTCDDETRTWRVIVSPLPPPVEVFGLNEAGEFCGIRKLSYEELDQLMLQSRAAYRIRHRNVGQTEVVTTTASAAFVLCQWVSSLIRNSQVSG